jgi:hypothetical protein
VGDGDLGRRIPSRGAPASRRRVDSSKRRDAFIYARVETFPLGLMKKAKGKKKARKKAKKAAKPVYRGGY